MSNPFGRPVHGDASRGSGKDTRVEPPRERCTILPLDDPRPILTLEDGTTVRADEAWENRALSGPCVGVAWANTSGGAYVRHERESLWRAAGRAAPFRDVDFSGWDCVRRVYPPPDDDRTAIIREELAAQARRTMHRESIARLRPGDEFRLSWHEDGVERSCWARMTGTRPAPYPCRGLIVGRTTFGLTVTTHVAHISDVRVEPNDAIRASWVGRHT